MVKHGAHQDPPGEQPAVDRQQGDQRRVEPRLERRAERLGKPHLRPQQGRGISRKQQQGGERPAAVAHPHPAFADAAAPAEPVPAGERDSAEPARLLPNRAPSVAGKWPRLATTPRSPGCAGMRTNIVLRPSAPILRPDLIILGHAGAGERLAVLQRGELGERLPGDRAADPGERDRRADRLAHHQLLDVRLGEFVAIMAADPARVAVGQRQDRKLDHRRAVDQPVEDPELERVDDVLGVVEHDRLGRACRSPVS